MITRVWHGWTTPANAPKYEALLQEEIFVGIEQHSLFPFLNNPPAEKPPCRCASRLRSRSGD